MVLPVFSGKPQQLREQDEATHYDVSIRRNPCKFTDSAVLDASRLVSDLLYTCTGGLSADPHMRPNQVPTDLKRFIYLTVRMME